MDRLIKFAAFIIRTFPRFIVYCYFLPWAEKQNHIEPDVECIRCAAYERRKRDNHAPTFDGRGMYCMKCGLTPEKFKRFCANKWPRKLIRQAQQAALVHKPVFWV